MSFHFISNKLRKNLKKEKKDIDKMMWLAGIVSPLTGIPQIILMYSTQSARDMSFLSWFLWMILSVVYLLYAVVHGIKPLAFSNAAWIAIYVLVLAGIWMFN